jgi:hypothetical protein
MSRLQQQKHPVAVKAREGTSKAETEHGTLLALQLEQRAVLGSVRVRRRAPRVSNQPLVGVAWPAFLKMVADTNRTQPPQNPRQLMQFLQKRRKSVEKEGFDDVRVALDSACPGTDAPLRRDARSTNNVRSATFRRRIHAETKQRHVSNTEGRWPKWYE